MQRLAEAVERQRLHVILQIGALLVAIGAGEQAELRRRHGQRAAPQQRIFGEHAGKAEARMIALVERGDAVDLVDQPQLQVILQVGADAGPVGDDVDAVLAQLRGRPDAGQQQELRRADRAGGENDFAAAARAARRAVLPPAHAGRALAVEDDAFGETAGFEPQIGAMQHRLEKGARRRDTAAALLVDVKGADAFVVAAVEVGNGFDAGLFGGGAEGVEQIPAHPRRRNVPFAADGMRVAFAEEMIFVPFEKRQHVVPAPAGKPELAPMVVVGGLAAHIDHGVDRGRAADHLAARIIEAAAIEPRHRLRS